MNKELLFFVTTMVASHLADQHDNPSILIRAGFKSTLDTKLRGAMFEALSGSYESAPFLTNTSSVSVNLLDALGYTKESATAALFASFPKLHAAIADVGYTFEIDISSVGLLLNDYSKEKTLAIVLDALSVAKGVDFVYESGVDDAVRLKPAVLQEIMSSSFGAKYPVEALIAQVFLSSSVLGDTYAGDVMSAAIKCFEGPEVPKGFEYYVNIDLETKLKDKSYKAYVDEMQRIRNSVR